MQGQRASSGWKPAGIERRGYRPISTPNGLLPRGGSCVPCGEKARLSPHGIQPVPPCHPYNCLLYVVWRQKGDSSSTLRRNILCFIKTSFSNYGPVGSWCPWDPASPNPDGFSVELPGHVCSETAQRRRDWLIFHFSAFVSQAHRRTEPCVGEQRGQGPLQTLSPKPCSGRKSQQ